MLNQLERLLTITACCATRLDIYTYHHGLHRYNDKVCTLATMYPPSYVKANALHILSVCLVEIYFPPYILNGANTKQLSTMLH